MRPWEFSGEVADSDDEDEESITALAPISHNAQRSQTASSQSVAKLDEKDVNNELGKENESHGSGQRPLFTFALSQSSNESEIDDSRPKTPHRQSTETSAAAAPARRHSVTTPGLSSSGVVRTRTPIAYHDIDSIISSPLSVLSVSPAPPSRPESNLHQSQGSSNRSTSAQESPIRSSARPNTADDFDLEIDLLNAGVAINPPHGARSFRQRTAQQLHPFLLDQARYERLCKDRGMRPVRVLQTANRSHVVHESHVSSSPERASESQSQLFSSTQHTVSSQSIPPEEDFLDLALTRPSQPDEARNGAKKRKLNYLASKKCAVIVSTRSDKISHSLFAVPLSPSISSQDGTPTDESHGMSEPAIPSLTRPAHFQWPRGMTPTQVLPTPQISSKMQAEAQDAIVEHEMSSPITQSRPALEVSIDSDDNSSSESDKESEANNAEVDRLQGIQKARKRIKGVLPASWLKIDLVNQGSKQRNAQADRSNNDSNISRLAEGPQKGVAKKVIHRPQRPSQAAIDLSDDDSSNEDSYTQQQDLELDQRQGITASDDMMLNSNIDVDEMEHDWIDHISAGGERQHIPGKIRTSNKRSHTFSSRHIPREERASRSIANASRAHDTHKRDRHKTISERKNNIRRSIVDAVSPNGDKMPQFVRIAARQARRAEDSGRHSPSNKHVRLSTRQDTQDVNAVLHRWRRGGIPRRNPRPRATDYDSSTASASVNGHARTNTHIGQFQNVLEAESSNSPLRNDRFFHTTSFDITDQRFENESDQATTGRLLDQNTSNHKRSKRTQPDRSLLSIHQRMRNGQLESIESSQQPLTRDAVFQGRIHGLKAPIRQTANTASAAIRLKPARVAEYHARLEQDVDDNQSAEARRVHTSAERIRRPRIRKLRPQCIAVQEAEYLQAEPPVSFSPVSEVEDVVVHEQSTGLHGFKAADASYSVNWSIEPLPRIVRFSEQSSIGNGSFADSLVFAKRDLDSAAVHIRITYGLSSFHWSYWNEEVKSNISQITDEIESAWRPSSNVLEPQDETARLASITRAVNLMKDIRQYFTYHLCFTDPVDRRDCVQAILRLIERLDLAVHCHHDSSSMLKKLHQKSKLMIMTFSLQATGLANTSTLFNDLRIKAQDILHSMAEQFATVTVLTGLFELRTHYFDAYHASDEYVIEEDSPISNMVQFAQILESTSSGTSFWRIMNQVMSIDFETMNDVNSYEKLWQNIFTLLPALDFDFLGRRQHTRYGLGGTECWNPLDDMQKHVLSLHDTTSQHSRSPINAYIRVMLRRAWTLINKHRWWKCDIWLRGMYDFFTSHGLSLLEGEVASGSPAFLSKLAKGADLEIQANDSSYHLFLKVLASALLNMRWNNVYREAKISSIAWRFIPNHARSYHKEADFREDDLDALRNHYDLLCVLYYASPANHRIGVHLLAELVDHNLSHRAACHLSVKAWTNLVNFQVSVDEGFVRLDPFIRWFNDMLEATSTQYRLARSEVEDDVNKARAQGNVNITNQAIETTVSNNQQQVATTLLELAIGMKNAVQSARSLGVVKYLVQACNLLNTLASFDASDRNLKAFILQVLDTIQACLTFKQTTNAQQSMQSEDSQDFGDFPSSQDLAQVMDNTPQEWLAKHADVMFHFISNVFGSDEQPDEVLLLRGIDTWILIAQQLVQTGQRAWNDFVDNYSPSAWTQFRSTAQHQKFTPYFLAKVVESCFETDHSLKSSILTMWTRSLVARESTLRFQHLLTESLLNYDFATTMLNNLPFAKDASDKYVISANDFRQRRISTISTLLANIRQYVDNYHSSVDSLQQRKQVSLLLIRQMMAAMKDNYKEVQTRSIDIASISNAQGAYIDFVHQVVSLLQQHTSSICPVDRFFTDSVSFPLPAHDPLYVVGRLRSYSTNLSTIKTQMELAVFFHTLCERALVDHQEAYLTDQLRVAVQDTAPERSQGLLHVLLGAIVPTYLDQIEQQHVWVLLVPILRAIAAITSEVHLHLDLTNSNDKTVLRLLLTSLAVSFDRMQEFSQSAWHLCIADLILEVCKAALMISELLEKSTNESGQVLPILRHVYKSCRRLQASARPSTADEELSDINSDDLQQDLSSWRELRGFMSRQISISMSTNWSTKDDAILIRRSNAWHQVSTTLRSSDVEAKFLYSLKNYCMSFEAVFGRRRNNMAVSRCLFKDFEEFLAV